MMNSESKKLIDNYIKSLIKGESDLLNKIGDIRAKLSPEDKPYFRKQYLAHSGKIEAKRAINESKLQKAHDQLIEELLIRH